MTGQRIELSTTGKPITLSLPAHADAQGMLKTRRGSIRSDFALEQDEDDEREARVQLGRGSVRLDLETDQDITLLRE